MSGIEQFTVVTHPTLGTEQALDIRVPWTEFSRQHPLCIWLFTKLLQNIVFFGKTQVNKTIPAGKTWVFLEQHPVDGVGKMGREQRTGLPVLLVCFWLASLRGSVSLTVDHGVSQPTGSPWNTLHARGI